jgi:hypothetical protein
MVFALGLGDVLCQLRHSSVLPRNCHRSQGGICRVDRFAFSLRSVDAMIPSSRDPDLKPDGRYFKAAAQHTGSSFSPLATMSSIPSGNGR